MSTPFGHEQSLLAARLAEHPSVSELDSASRSELDNVSRSELDSASIGSPSILAPTASSEDSDKIPMSAVSALHIHDGLIPVEGERDVGKAPPVEADPVEEQPVEEQPVSAMTEESPQEPEPPKKPEVIRVDRSTLTFRTPKSTVGAKSPALQKTLITAVEGRKTNIVEQLLDRGVPPDTGTEKNAVCIATYNTDSPTLKLLLEFGADPNESMRQDGITALRLGCNNRAQQAQILLEWGADPNQFSQEWSPLTRANENKCSDAIRMLLKYGADPNLIDKRNQSPLANFCLREQEPELVSEYIAYGADPNMKDGNRWTPLQVAIDRNQVKLVEALLQNGADPNVEGEKLPIWEALRHPECMKLLLKHGVNTNLAVGSLELAVARDYVETAIALLDHGVSPNEKMRDHYSPLSTAVRENHSQLVDLLLSRGADPNMKGEDWPLVMALRKLPILKQLHEAGADWKKCPEIIELAAVHNAIEGFKYLLEIGAPVDTPHPKVGYYALGSAIRENRKEIFNMCLEAGADPNLKGQDYPLRMAIGRPHFIKPLIEHGADPKKCPGIIETAVFHNNLEPIKEFLAAGLDINEPNPDGYLPLTTAIRDNRFEMFKFLLENGADPNIRFREDPFMMAVPRGNKFISPLLAAGADPKLSPKVVEYAVYHNNLDAVKALVEEGGMDANYPHPDGYFPATTAIRDRHPEMLRYVLSKNPDLSTVPHLVQWAVEMNSLESVQIALEAGVNPNLRKKSNGATALTTAIHQDRTEILTYLLEHGADPNAPGERDALPILIAVEKEKPDILNALLQKGADATAVREHDGASVLHIACWRGKSEHVKSLIEKGADINFLDKNQKAPLDIAAERGHDEVVMTLLESME